MLSSSKRPLKSKTKVPPRKKYVFISSKEEKEKEKQKEQLIKKDLEDDVSAFERADYWLSVWSNPAKRTQDLYVLLINEELSFRANGERFLADIICQQRQQWDTVSRTSIDTKK